MLFISHASADDAFVAKLRQALEALGISVWVDSRNLLAGSKLAQEIEEKIEQAKQFLVVLSPSTINSSWVRREIEKALEVEHRRKAEGYRVIPLLLPGITPGALGTWFDEEPVAVPIEVGPGGLSAALPGLLAALGEQLPTDHPAVEQPAARLLEELVLELTDPKIETQEGKHRATAMATLVYEPAQPGARRVESPRFAFTAPLGPIEAADLRWYLETYYIWPDKMAQQRAEGIASRLPQWGQDLYQAALGSEAGRDALTAWQQASKASPAIHISDVAERRFSVQVDRELPAGSQAEAKAAAGEAATELLALPWELLHDGRTWLFQGRHAVRVRRRLPNRHPQPARPTTLPIRILLVSPRPEKDDHGNPIGYIDHRVSARPLIEAVENLGDLARLTILQPPTYAALEKALLAGDDDQPFDVVHFDGHGVYDRRLGLGGLCFEDPERRRQAGGSEAGLRGRRPARRPGPRAPHPARLPRSLPDRGGRGGSDRFRGRAAARRRSHLRGGHEPQRAGGDGQAFRARVLRRAGQRRASRPGDARRPAGAVRGRPDRGKVLGAGELRLQDWFVPVLYQEEQDPQLITRISPQEVQQLEAKKRRLSLGALPEPPPHHFQGRSRELLALERLLHRELWAVVRGTGGQGKTTLAVELARWLTRTGRFARAAFVNLERYRDVRAVLDTLGHQLLPQGDKYSVAQFRDFDEAIQHVERALAGQPTILVLDNCESVLPERGEPAASEDAASAIFSLCRRLLEADPRTRLVFTTREPLPPPFAAAKCERELGALDRNEAIELVSEVMKQSGWTPPSDDVGSTPQEITDLVEAVNRHARALVLLAREVTRRGVKGTTGDLRSLMANLERKHPGDRENSLYASVELSLRRLSPESREHVRVLAVCQGGVHLAIIGMLTGLEPDAARQLAIELIEVGLGEDMGYGHLRLDPGLPPYLLGELSDDEADALRSRWAEATAQLTGYLYRELFKNARLARQLTLLELPNFLAMLDWLQARMPPEQVVSLASNVEQLMADLGRPQALARATRVREQAAQTLGDWSHARFLAESASIDRLLERGDFPTALAAAQQLLEKCLAAREAAYPEAAYDIAMAYWLLGRVLKMGSAAEAALAPLGEAQRRFQKLADVGNTVTQRMTSVAIADTGDCLSNLGRLPEAADAYEESIRRSESLDDLRQVAVNKFQLGTVRLLQKRYREALEIYTETRDAFKALGEPRQLSTVWHQIGMAHEDAGQFEPAEQSYRQSLAISVQENDLAGQARTLGQLGNLYDGMGRLEEAATFYRQAADAYARLEDLANEGRARSNLADTLIKRRRYDEARHEIQRAIECKRPYGHAAEPGGPGQFWKISNVPPAAPKLRRPPGSRQSRPIWPIAAPVASARTPPPNCLPLWPKRSSRTPYRRFRCN